MQQERNECNADTKKERRSREAKWEEGKMESDSQRNGGSGTETGMKGRCNERKGGARERDVLDTSSQAGKKHKCSGRVQLSLHACTTAAATRFLFAHLTRPPPTKLSWKTMFSAAAAAAAAAAAKL